VYISLLEKCGILIIYKSICITYVTTANREAPYVFSCDRSHLPFRIQTTAGKLSMHGCLPCGLAVDSGVQENPSPPIRSWVNHPMAAKVGLREPARICCRCMQPDLLGINHAVAHGCWHGGVSARACKLAATLFLGQVCILCAFPGPCLVPKRFRISVL